MVNVNALDARVSSPVCHRASCPSRPAYSIWAPSSIRGAWGRPRARPTKSTSGAVCRPCTGGSAYPDDSRGTRSIGSPDSPGTSPDRPPRTLRHRQSPPSGIRLARFGSFAVRTRQAGGRRTRGRSRRCRIWTTRAEIWLRTTRLAARVLRDDSDDSDDVPLATLARRKK